MGNIPLRAARQRPYLHGAGAFQVIDAQIGIGAIFSHRQGAVVAQQHEMLVTHVGHQADAFFHVCRDAFIVVIGQIFQQHHGVLVQR